MKHKPPVSVDEREEPGDRITLIEESAEIEKRSVVSRRVRVRTVTETFEQDARADLMHEDVEIERVKIDRVVERAPEIRVEGDTTIVPVMEEVMFVETRLVLKEELRIRRHMRTETITTPVKLRRQRAVVDSVDPAGVSINTPEAKG